MIMTLIAASVSVPDSVSAWMNDNLRDAQSAIVQEVKPPQRRKWKVRHLLIKTAEFDATLYCLRINGKNAYGGYNGFEGFLFVVDDDGALKEQFYESYSWGDEKQVDKYCSKD